MPPAASSVDKRRSDLLRDSFTICPLVDSRGVRAYRGLAVTAFVLCWVRGVAWQLDEASYPEGSKRCLLLPMLVGPPAHSLIVFAARSTLRAQLCDQALAVKPP
jgi:hypothetical protein